MKALPKPATEPDQATTDLLDNAPPEVLAALNQLNVRQQAFALALPTAKNHAQAAISAGYSAQNVAAQANKLYRNRHVRMVYRYLSSSALERAGITTERCFRELGKLAFANPAAVFDDNGQLLPPKLWPTDVAASVTEIKLGDEPKLKFSDKHAVLRTLLELANAFPDKRSNINVDHKIGVVTVPLKVDSQAMSTATATAPMSAASAPLGNTATFVLPHLAHD